MAEEKTQRTPRTEKFSINLTHAEVIQALEEYLKGHYGDEAVDTRASINETLPVYYNKVAK